jgi:uncharacterized protein
MFAADLENPWILAVLRAPRRAPAALVAIGGVAVAAALTFAGRASAAVVGPTLAGLAVFAGLVAVAVAAARGEGRRLWPREVYGAGALVGGLALGLGALFAGAALASKTGAASVALNPAGAPMSPFAAAVLIAGLGAVAQEMFFRGWMQPALCAAWGAWPGLLFVAALFTAFHIAAGAHGAFVIVNLALAGLLFGLLSLRSGGLAASSAAHLVWAWTGFAGLTVVPAGQLFEVAIRGSAPWSGGGQGLGGSLAVTAVLVVLLLTLVIVKPEVRSGATAAAATPQRSGISRK